MIILKLILGFIAAMMLLAGICILFKMNFNYENKFIHIDIKTKYTNK